MRNKPSTGFCRTISDLNRYVLANPNHKWMRKMLDEYRDKGRLTYDQLRVVREVLEERASKCRGVGS